MDAASDGPGKTADDDFPKGCWKGCAIGKSKTRVLDASADPSSTISATSVYGVSNCQRVTKAAAAIGFQRGD